MKRISSSSLTASLRAIFAAGRTLACFIHFPQDTTWELNEKRRAAIAGTQLHEDNFVIYISSCCQVMVDVWQWLSTHEWLAIWLEGIALVAIFILELRQFKRSNRETLDQLEIAKQQAEAARLTAQSLVNSERAWLTGDLEWFSDKGRILFTDTQVPPDKATTTTNAHLAGCGKRRKFCNEEAQSTSNGA